MRAAVPLVWLLLAALLTGCEVVNEGNAHIGRDRLVEDMSQQLQRGEQVRFQAEYRLAGGLRATVGQQISPARTFYGYPGGLLIVSEGERTSCDNAAARAKCEIRAKGGNGGGNGEAETFAAVTRKGLVAAPVVAELLRVATQQPGAMVKGHDTTVAGLPASCLEILNLADAISANFSACVTADGVLASFSGLIDGVNVDQALEQLALRAPDPTLFVLPGNADVVDLRQA
jgi:hypothetical protein